MNAIPTTTVTLRRPATVPDGWDNAASPETTVGTGIPASIAEDTRTVRGRGVNDPRVARHIIGRVTGGTGVQRNDRLVDERYGHTYAVVSVRQPQNPVMVLDEVLELTRSDQQDP